MSKKLISVYLDEEEIKRIKKLAQQEQRAVSNMATVLIRIGLENVKK